MSAHPEQRWLALFASTRAIATATAAALLIGHRVTSHDGLLAAIAITYSLGSLVAIVRSRRLQRLPAVWVADSVAVLVLVIASAQWRSPFYLLALTTLVLPATTLPFSVRSPTALCSRSATWGSPSPPGSTGARSRRRHAWRAWRPI